MQPRTCLHASACESKSELALLAAAAEFAILDEICKIRIRRARTMPIRHPSARDPSIEPRYDRLSAKTSSAIQFCRTLTMEAWKRPAAARIYRCHQRNTQIASPPQRSAGKGAGAAGHFAPLFVAIVPRAAIGEGRLRAANI